MNNKIEIYNSEYNQEVFLNGKKLNYLKDLSVGVANDVDNLAKVSLTIDYCEIEYKQLKRAVYDPDPEPSVVEGYKRFVLEIDDLLDPELALIDALRQVATHCNTKLNAKQQRRAIAYFFNKINDEITDALDDQD